MNWAELYLSVVAAWLLVGTGFAAWFLTIGAARLDPDVLKAGSLTRLLLLPGSVLLWPVLLRRVIQGGAP